MARITLKHKTSTGGTPTAGIGATHLDVGEVGLNTADGHLWMNQNTAVTKIGAPIAATGELLMATATAAAATALLDAATTTVKGLVPAPPNDAAKFLDGTGVFSTPAGSGNVSNTGTPVDNQIAVWTSATVVEGDAAFTFDATTDTLSIGNGTDGTIQLGTETIIDNLFGTISLSNINEYGLSASDIPDISATYETADATIIKQADLITSTSLASASDTTAASSLAIKTYVDATAQGLIVHEAVRCHVAADIIISSALNAGDVIDSITLVAGDKVLVSGQTTATENGVYIVDASPFRDLDLNTGDQAAGVYVFVTEGTSYQGTGWVCTSGIAADTVGTHDLDFTQFSGAGEYTAANGVKFNASSIELDIPNMTDDTTPTTAYMLAAWDGAAHKRIDIADIPLDGGTWA